LRDVRVLRDQLLGGSDWDAAGHAYAAEHDRYYSAMHKGEDWFATLFFAGGAEAEARRARALPLIGADPSRVPDFQFSGPEVPSDESVRRRFFGEE
jgi:menaquinone-9 beta-reductase